MRAELIKIKGTGIYQGQVLPKAQLDNMDKRFQDVASKLSNLFSLVCNMKVHLHILLFGTSGKLSQQIRNIISKRFVKG